MRLTLLGILLGVLESVWFSSVFLGGALGFPTHAIACKGVPAGARLCKYWRGDHLQLLTRYGSALRCRDGMPTRGHGSAFSAIATCRGCGVATFNRSTSNAE